MKLTKSKLKQIIQEEMEEYTTSMVVNSLEDALKTVLPTIEHAYASLSDNRSKAEFEDHLLKNIEMYVDKWREERDDGDELTKDIRNRSGGEWPPQPPVPGTGE